MNTTQTDLNEKSNSERKQVEEYLDNLNYRKRINRHQKNVSMWLWKYLFILKNSFYILYIRCITIVGEKK